MLFWVLKFHNIGLNTTVLKKYVFEICLGSKHYDSVSVILFTFR